METIVVTHPIIYNHQNSVRFHMTHQILSSHHITSQYEAPHPGITNHFSTARATAQTSPCSNSNSKLLITFDLDVLLMSKKTEHIFLLTDKRFGESTEPWLYGKAKICTLKIENSLLFMLIFNKYLA